MDRTTRHSETRYGNRPTMKDVAARAGVGLKTVSRVVNSEPGVTPDTERRVQEAIDALGFRRNDSARVLRKGRTASIGLVLEDLADPFYGPLSRAVEEVARAHGALLISGRAPGIRKRSPRPNWRRSPRPGRPCGPSWWSGPHPGPSTPSTG
ncbi:HTH-type transcriptional repressor PurR [Streptomyces badius]